MKALKRDIVIGIVFSVIAGTLAHFVYEWSGENPIAAIFFPIDESVWEHVKLLFFPTLFYCLFLIKKWKKVYPCIIPSVPVGIVIGSLSIPAFFYFYTAILGTHVLVLDILIFIVSVVICFWVIYKITLSCKIEGNAGWILLAAIGISFWVK
ncbi:MAG: DUF6512 family protein [Bacillota bacterium]|nr:DUF6512 family protein [Bacillota bacterium]